MWQLQCVAAESGVKGDLRIYLQNPRIRLLSDEAERRGLCMGRVTACVAAGEEFGSKKKKKSPFSTCERPQTQQPPLSNA